MGEVSCNNGTMMWYDAMWCVIRCLVWHDLQKCGVQSGKCLVWPGQLAETGTSPYRCASGIGKNVAWKPKEDPLQLTCWMVRLPVQVQVWIIQILTCSHMLIHVAKLAESPCDNTCVNLKFVTPWNLMCPSHWCTWCKCAQRWLPNVEDLRERAQPSMLSMLCFNHSIPGYLDVPLSGACPLFWPPFPHWNLVDVGGFNPSQEHDSVKCNTHPGDDGRSNYALETSSQSGSRHDSSFSGTPGKNVWPVDNYQACWYTQIVCGV